MERPTDLEHDHWRLSTSLAVWVFELPRAATETVQAALRRYACEALEHVGSLAAIRRVEWITRSAGDDAAVLQPDAEIDLGEVQAVFDRLSDVLELSAALDLRCTSTEGIDFRIPYGAALRVLAHEEDDGNTLVLLELALHADVYAPLTRGEIRDTSGDTSKPASCGQVKSGQSLQDAGRVARSGSVLQVGL